ncbi:hypothetical protein Tco_1342437 [Tanacetum coccineum]
MEEAMLPRVHHEFLMWGTSNKAAKTRYNTNLARLLPRQIYSLCSVDLGVLNAMGCAEEIEAMLEIKVYEMGSQEEIFSFEAWRSVFDIKEPIYTKLCHEFYSTYEFDEVVTDDELMTKKLIKGLRSDENFNDRDYWLSNSSEEELHLSRGLASIIRSPILRVIQKMITYGLCQRTTGYDKVQINELWLMSMFEANNQNGYTNVAWLMAKWLKGTGVGSQKISIDATTLRELIGSNRRLLAEDPAPGVPRVAMPRDPRPSMQYLYDRMGSMVIRQGVLERMARRKSY